MPPNGSPKTVAASSNETLCLARFAAAFCGSHSNSSANLHYTRPSEDHGFRHESPGVIPLGRFNTPWRACLLVPPKRPPISQTSRLLHLLFPTTCRHPPPNPPNPASILKVGRAGIPSGSACPLPEHHSCPLSVKSLLSKTAFSRRPFGQGKKPGGLALAA